MRLSLAGSGGAVAQDPVLVPLESGENCLLFRLVLPGDDNITPAIQDRTTASLRLGTGILDAGCDAVAYGQFIRTE